MAKNPDALKLLQQLADQQQQLIALAQQMTEDDTPSTPAPRAGRPTTKAKPAAKAKPARAARPQAAPATDLPFPGYDQVASSERTRSRHILRERTDDELKA